MECSCVAEVLMVCRVAIFQQMQSLRAALCQTEFGHNDNFDEDVIGVIFIDVRCTSLGI